MEANFKKQHPDFQDDDDLNEETPVLPKPVAKKTTILSKRFWPLWLTFGISMLGATIMAVGMPLPSVCANFGSTLINILPCATQPLGY